MPDGESVRFLMIFGIPAGSTNPPPEAWFTKAETWNKHVREEGIVIVPRALSRRLSSWLRKPAATSARCAPLRKVSRERSSALRKI
jgi:hypothetical protein